MTNRREFFTQIGNVAARTVLILGALVGLVTLRPSRSQPSGTRRNLGILRPPGSLEESEFLSLCIGCRRCADSCEAQCLEFFGPEAGLLEGTPYILSEKRGCTLCLHCGEACPSGAITPLLKKEEVAMGVAIVDDRLCVTYTQRGESSACTVCHTVCPLRNTAITLENGHPRTHSRFCVGCGLCEAACVVKNRRAIQVRTPRKWLLTAGDVA